MDLTSILDQLLDRRQQNDTVQETESDSDTQTQRVYNFMAIPAQVERLMFYGYMICVNSFLGVFTILPLRTLYAIVNLLQCKRNARNRKHFEYLIQSSLLVSSVLCLMQVDSSKMYHSIRGQSALKLYVIYNVLEICDKLCSSFGQDVLHAAYRYGEGDGWVLLHATGKWILAFLYLIMHSMVLFYQVMTLNVAINSHNNALLTLLVSNQFVEIKGSVFKKFSAENLFQLSMADIIERFNLSIFLVLIFVRNALEFSQISYDQWWGWLMQNPFSSTAVLEQKHVLLYSCLSIYASEIAIDWIKHAFITKFNLLKPDVYARYVEILSRDLLTNQRGSVFDVGQSVAQRIGFSSLPLACLFLRLMIVQLYGIDRLKTLQSAVRLVSMISAILIILIFIKYRVSVSLVAMSQRYTSSTTIQSNITSTPSTGTRKIIQFKEADSTTLLSPAVKAQLVRFQSMPSSPMSDKRSINSDSGVLQQKEEYQDSPKQLDQNEQTKVEGGDRDSDREVKVMDRDDSSVMMHSPSQLSLLREARILDSQDDIRIEPETPLNLENIGRFTMFKSRIP
ncbi:hypothetical protein MP228_009465 [Amoeboaphelidium protococcarum]|nr:hypothetical protein MP228_009465 [Amoeboaphelidium protococcarum]